MCLINTDKDFVTYLYKKYFSCLFLLRSQKNSNNVTGLLRPFSTRIHAIFYYKTPLEWFSIKIDNGMIINITREEKNVANVLIFTFYT